MTSTLKYSLRLRISGMVLEIWTDSRGPYIRFTDVEGWGKRYKTRTRTEFWETWLDMKSSLTSSELLECLELLWDYFVPLKPSAGTDLEQCLRNLVGGQSMSSLAGLLAWKRSSLGIITA